MKLSLVVFMLALLTTTFASRFNIFRRELEGKKNEFDQKTVKKIEHEIDEELEIGEELAADIAGEEHEKEGDISICVIQLFEDAGHSFERTFVDKEDGKEEEKDEGEGEDVLRDLRSSLVRRFFRFKRSAESEPLPFSPPPTRGPSRKPSNRPSARPTGGEKRCSGALERFFQCMKKQLGDLEEKGGEGEGHHEGGHESGSGEDEGGEEESELIKPVKMHKRKIRKHIA